MSENSPEEAVEIFPPVILKDAFDGGMFIKDFTTNHYQTENVGDEVIPFLREEENSSAPEPVDSSTSATLQELPKQESALSAMPPPPPVKQTSANAAKASTPLKA